MIALAVALLVAPADTAFRSWTYGSRVHVGINWTYIRADSLSSSRILDSVLAGVKGTLVGGPWLAADGAQRWKVRYDAKPLGWTRQSNLVMDTLFIPPPVATPPGTVTDLAVQSVTDTSATLSFTTVADGAGGMASYDVRYMPGAITWGAATEVSRGTCATPVVGTATGVRRTCTVLGLAASTTYGFQTVAFRGVLGTATFGGLSNIATGTTATASVVPPPPTKVVVSAVTVQPAFPSIIETQWVALYGVVSRNDGSAIPTNARLQWSSSDTTVAVVSDLGMVSALRTGTATITARDSSGISGQSIVSVTSAQSFRVNGIQLEGNVLPLFSGAFALTFTSNGARVGRALCQVAP